MHKAYDKGYVANNTYTLHMHKAYNKGYVANNTYILHMHKAYDKGHVAYNMYYICRRLTTMALWLTTRTIYAEGLRLRLCG